MPRPACLLIYALLGIASNLQAAAAPSPAHVPAWRKGLKPDTANLIPGTSPSKFSLGYGWGAGSAMAYSGFQYDVVRNVIYLGLGGGHAEPNQQNGIYKCDLMRDNTPAQPIQWTVVKASDPNPGNDYNKPYLSTGRPVSRHTYYDGHCVEVGGKPVLVFTIATAANVGSQTFATTDIFHFDTNEWDLNGKGVERFPRADNQIGFSTTNAVNRKTQEIYVMGREGAILKFTPSTQKWSTVTPNKDGAGNAYAGALYDIKRDRIVIGGNGSYWPKPGVHEVKAFTSYSFAGGGALANNVATGPGAAYIGASPQREDGFIHDTVKDRYLYLSSGGLNETAIISVDPETWECTVLIKGLPPCAGGGGGRFEYLPELGGACLLTTWGDELCFIPSK